MLIGPLVGSHQNSGTLFITTSKALSDVLSTGLNSRPCMILHNVVPSRISSHFVFITQLKDRCVFLTALYAMMFVITKVMRK